jgi:hypothetical protein
MRQDDFGLLAALEKLNGREGLAHFFGGEQPNGQFFVPCQVNASFSSGRISRYSPGDCTCRRLARCFSTAAGTHVEL